MPQPTWLGRPHCLHRPGHPSPEFVGHCWPSELARLTVTGCEKVHIKMGHWALATPNICLGVGVTWLFVGNAW